MLRKSVLRDGIDGYNPLLRNTEDYELWIRLASSGKFANIPEPLYHYRINKSGAYLSNLKKNRAVARGFGQKYWKTFGKGGPAPINEWKKIWSKSVINKNPTKERSKNYSNLHLSFSIEYLRKLDFIFCLVKN